MSSRYTAGARFRGLPAYARYVAALRNRRAARALALRAALPAPPTPYGYGATAPYLRRVAGLARARRRAAAALYAYAALTSGPPTPPGYRYPVRGPYRALTYVAPPSLAAYRAPVPTPAPP